MIGRNHVAVRVVIGWCPPLRCRKAVSTIMALGSWSTFRRVSISVMPHGVKHIPSSVVPTSVTPQAVGAFGVRGHLVSVYFSERRISFESFLRQAKNELTPILS